MVGINVEGCRVSGDAWAQGQVQSKGMGVEMEVEAGLWKGRERGCYRRVQTRPQKPSNRANAQIPPSNRTLILN